jgi:predicted enzyme related to lactoylglutathione lyase
MTSPARAGVLIYANDVERTSMFYEKVLNATVLHADQEHRVLQAEDTQLILHAIPAQYAESIVIPRPPAAREQQAIKPFFTVPDLDSAERMARESGGLVWGPVWSGPGMRVRNVCDPEGNIIHLRQSTA